jgi:hypothetical protein
MDKKQTWQERFDNHFAPYPGREFNSKNVKSFLQAELSRQLEQIEAVIEKEAKRWEKAIKTTNYPEKNEIVYAAKSDALADLKQRIAEMK